MTRRGLAAAIAVAGTLATSTAFGAENSEAEFRGRNPSSIEASAMHADFCKDYYARAVGRMAFLQTRLALTPAQQSLFGAWKNVVLQHVETRTNTCAAEVAPFSPPGFVARKEREAQRLKERLAAIEAEMPTLSAFYQSLSPEQRRALDFSGYGHRERPRGWGHEFSDGMPNRESD